MFWRSLIALIPLAMGAQEMSNPPLSRLASGPDGSYVLFQSRLGRKGLNEAGREKIFRWDATGLSVAAERTGRDVVEPQLSADGRVFAFSVLGGETVFRTPTGEVSRPGRWRMSRNGDRAVKPTARRRIDLRSRAEVAVGCEDQIVNVVNGGRVFCTPSERAV